MGSMTFYKLNNLLSSSAKEKVTVPKGEDPPDPTMWSSQPCGLYEQVCWWGDNGRKSLRK